MWAFPMMGPLMSLCDARIAPGVSLAKDSNPQKHVTTRKRNRISSSLPQAWISPRAVESNGDCNKKGWRSSASLLVKVEVTERCKRVLVRAARSSGAQLALLQCLVRNNQCQIVSNRQVGFRVGLAVESQRGYRSQVLVQAQERIERALRHPVDHGGADGPELGNFRRQGQPAAYRACGRKSHAAHEETRSGSRICRHAGGKLYTKRRQAFFAITHRTNSKGCRIGEQLRAQERLRIRALQTRNGFIDFTRAAPLQVRRCRYKHGDLAAFDQLASGVWRRRQLGHIEIVPHKGQAEYANTVAESGPPG